MAIKRRTSKTRCQSSQRKTKMANSVNRDTRHKLSPPDNCKTAHVHSELTLSTYNTNSPSRVSRADLRALLFLMKKMHLVTIQGLDKQPDQHTTLLWTELGPLKIQKLNPYYQAWQLEGRKEGKKLRFNAMTKLWLWPTRTTAFTRDTLPSALHPLPHLSCWDREGDYQKPIFSTLFLDLQPPKGQKTKCL